MSLCTTTSQTVGPYFKIGMQWLYRDNLAAEGVAGEHVTIEGRVLDGDGHPVTDAIFEIWQANSHGKYDHPEDTQDKPLQPNFRGFGRVSVNSQGVFRFTTIKPGSVPGPNEEAQAPHLLISVFMRGILRRLVTRMYFPEDPANANDAILKLVEAARRPTLIAKKDAQVAGTLKWNVHLQGPEETVFFDLGL